MASTISSSVATHDQVVLATCISSPGRPVVSCPSPGDAASPVYLHLGSYVRQIGQAADYRHDVSRAAELHGAELVASYYHDGQWQHSTTADGERVREHLRRWEAEERSRQEEARAEREAVLDAQYATQQRVLDVLTRHFGQRPERVRWTDSIVADDDARLTDETQTALRRRGGSYREYDALVDGQAYRVRVGVIFGSVYGPEVIPLVRR